LRESGYVTMFMSLFSRLQLRGFPVHMEGS